MSEPYADLDPQVPLLLVPLRLETRTRQHPDGTWSLRVRIHPDEVSVCRLDRGITEAEAAAARAWWRARWEDERADPWRELVAAVGSERATYVAEALRPSNSGDRGTADPVFPAPPAGATAQQTTLLPEVLRVVVTQAGDTVSQVGERLPAEGVPTGSASGDLAALVRQLEAMTADEPDADDPLAWTVSFAAAQRIGLGIEVPLPHGRAPVERVVVLGVRGGTDADATAAELAWLLESHHRTAGTALPGVGTPTNNTPDRRAGWGRTLSAPGRPALDPP
ncbi:MAG TPA: hypothetical protein VF661_08575, partial [Actinomycetales bacterium]